MRDAGRGRTLAAGKTARHTSRDGAKTLRGIETLIDHDARTCSRSPRDALGAANHCGDGPGGAVPTTARACSSTEAAPTSKSCSQISLSLPEIADAVPAGRRQAGRRARGHDRTCRRRTSSRRCALLEGDRRGWARRIGTSPRSRRRGHASKMKALRFGRSGARRGARARGSPSTRSARAEEPTVSVALWRWC